MEADGVISNRGIKADAFRYGELVFDVNSAYFYNHGGYDFAKQFYTEAYKAAIKIVGGLLLGLSRACVAEFTFFLAIPVMAGASLLKVVKFVLSGAAMTGTEIAVLVVGCVVAFVVSLAAIRFLMDYVKRHNFKFFGLYRIVLGLIVLAVAAITAIA